MASSELSNFQKFQQILTKRPLTTVSENNDAEWKLPPPPRVPSRDGSEQDEHSPIIPFLRQTFQWDEQSQLYVENREAPDEDWKTWEAFSTNETPEVWVRYHKIFNKLGVKSIERLVIRADDATVRFLNLAEYGPSDDDLFNQREEGYVTRGVDRERDFYRRSDDAVIDEKLFRGLFFRYSEIKEEIATTSSEVMRRVLTILTGFLDYTFSDAKEGYQDACRTGQVLFNHAWTLFRPGDIVYERLTVAPFQDSYEQCFSVHSSEYSISQFDGTRVLCLTLVEITYRSSQANTHGPATVWTTRYIQEYDGVKQITTEDLGIVPFDMMASEKRDIIKAALKHTHENVVVDITTSNMHFKSRFSGNFETFHWSEHPTNQEEPRVIRWVDFSKDDAATEALLLVCRGYLPGYLVASSVYAVGILISELRPPVWTPPVLPSATSSLLPDMAQWSGLVHDFLKDVKDAEDLEADLGRHQARGSGLILALEGSKIISRKVADQISHQLKKPLVCIDMLDDDLELKEAIKPALRWGAILFVEFRNVSSDQYPYRVLDLRNHASFYSSVILLSCNATNELGDHCEEMVDSVISCRLPSKDEPVALWELTITEQTPGLSAEMSDDRLCEICPFLAQLEMRETRIEKILTTAKRMAVTEKVQLSLQHVVAVIRLSVSPDKLGEFESVARMGMQKLGYN
ncbi:hypothetical protein NW768_007659 [Fusarium equiseti]|uniref:DUF7025 domain-containing protein n=1 Tax=Fusarium equiseti TaxID=61235 RepID=A0ABQ8R8B3_FUSEQ|nr:hypothetical protein NW768_007659 [Fusarium equiseti]